jgi:hypothetical protein
MSFGSITVEKSSYHHLPQNATPEACKLFGISRSVFSIYTPYTTAPPRLNRSLPHKTFPIATNPRFKYS